MQENGNVGANAPKTKNKYKEVSNEDYANQVNGNVSDEVAKERLRVWAAAMEARTRAGGVVK